MLTRKTKALSIIEYVVLILIILGGLYVSKDYILRGFMGHWKSAGDSFSFGRQFDPQKSVDCVFDDAMRVWYDRNCFEDQRQRQCKIGDVACEQGLLGRYSLCVAGTACDSFNSRQN
jgi:hypothetical protein